MAANESQTQERTAARSDGPKNELFERLIAFAQAARMRSEADLLSLGQTPEPTAARTPKPPVEPSPHPHKQRIRRTDTLEEALCKLSEGNEIARSILDAMVAHGARIDPDSAIGPLSGPFDLDHIGVYGSDIVTLHEILCGSDLIHTMAVLRAEQLGKLPRLTIISAIRGEHTLPVEQIRAAVTKILPRFGEFYGAGYAREVVKADGAVIRYDGEGRVHSDDRPAVIMADGRATWFRHGVRLDRTQILAISGPEEPSESNVGTNGCEPPQPMRY